MSQKTVPQLIREFLQQGPYAVVGASRRRHKYGNKVLRAYQQSGLSVYPINPQADEVEGLLCYPDLASLPEAPRGISVITPPEVTRTVVENAAEVGVRYAWMQPGAEGPEALAAARAAGIDVIADGSCLLVVVGFRE